jgi:hypothetical protein
LDFGSGNGAFLNFFKNKVKKLYSLEISKNFINFQKKYLTKTKYILTNPTNVDFFKKVDYKEILICMVLFMVLNNKIIIELIYERVPYIKVIESPYPNLIFRTLIFGIAFFLVKKFNL